MRDQECSLQGQREERRRGWHWHWHWHCPELGTAVSAVCAVAGAAVPVVVVVVSAAAACGGWETMVASWTRTTEAPCTAQSSALGIGW